MNRKLPARACPLANCVKLNSNVIRGGGIIHVLLQTLDYPKVVAKISQVQARHNARVKAMQALYQWDLNDSSVSDIEKQFLDTQEMGRVDLEYFKAILHSIPATVDTLDEALVTCLDRPVQDLDPIERAICRIGAWELIERPEVPLKVVINECVEITKKFGADQGHKFVNGVVDKLAKNCRPLEFAALNKS